MPSIAFLLFPKLRSHEVKYRTVTRIEGVPPKVESDLTGRTFTGAVLPQSYHFEVGAEAFTIT
jgi:hypothetical protein